jgi:hypothetical protein
MMDKKEICLIVKAIAAGMLAACQTMTEEKETPDER